MWERYLEIAMNMTREFWPLLVIPMLVFVIPLMLFRVSRNSHLAAIGIKQLQSKIEELQMLLETSHKDGSPSLEPEAVSENLAVDVPKKQNVETVLGVSAKVCQTEKTSDDVKSESPQENIPLAAEAFSCDGNLAVQQPEFPQTFGEGEPGPVLTPPVETKAAPEKEPKARAEPEPNSEPALGGTMEPAQEVKSEPALGGITEPALEPKSKPVPVPKSGPVAAPTAAKKDRHVVRCSKCGNKMAYKGEWSGKRVKCPFCKETLSLP